MNRRDACLVLLAGLPALTCEGRPVMADVSGELRITTARARPPVERSEDHFTGTVRISTQVEPPALARVLGGTVAFAPGARTAWHTHPLGQTLIVTAGRGWVQRVGRAPQPLETGDVVWIPPDVRHWHGAAADAALTHVAIVEQSDGRSVTRMKKASDAEYLH